MTRSFAVINKIATLRDIVDAYAALKDSYVSCPSWFFSNKFKSNFALIKNGDSHFYIGYRPPVTPLPLDIVTYTYDDDHQAKVETTVVPLYVNNMAYTTKPRVEYQRK